MQKDVTLIARIDADLSDRLTRESERTGESKSQILSRALKAYLDGQPALADIALAPRPVRPVR